MQQAETKPQNLTESSNDGSISQAFSEPVQSNQVPQPSSTVKHQESAQYGSESTKPEKSTEQYDSVSLSSNSSDQRNNPNDKTGLTATTETAKHVEAGGLPSETDLEAAKPPSNNGQTTPDALSAEKKPPVHTVFTKKWKLTIAIMSALGAFISPISANLYFPALPTLAAYYHVSDSLINLTLTTYMIFQGIAPAFFGDFADSSGHRPAFLLSMVIYFGANVGCALQSNYAALLVLRCLQSAGASGTVALRNAVIANVITPAERGTWLGLLQTMNLVAPALGPLIGGLLTKYLGWRSTFWFLVILTGVYVIPYIIIMPETNRRIVGNGSVPPENWWNKSVLDFIRPWPHGTEEERREQLEDPNSKVNSKLKMKLPRPWRTLVPIMEKDVAICLFYGALIYAALYAILTTIPALFTRLYGFNELQVGLCYLPGGISMGIAAFSYGRLLDWNYRRVAKANGFPVDKKRRQNLRHFPIETARLQPQAPFLVMGATVLLCYGWPLQEGASVAAPLVLQFLLGGTLLATFGSLSNLVVDLYPDSPATITAATNLVRCMFGAAGTAIINPMLDGVGVGWTYTILGGILFLFSPLLLLLKYRGPKWREARAVRMERKKEAKEAKEAEKNSCAEKGV